MSSFVRNELTTKGINEVKDAETLEVKVHKSSVAGSRSLSLPIEPGYTEKKSATNTIYNRLRKIFKAQEIKISPLTLLFK